MSKMSLDTQIYCMVEILQYLIRLIIYKGRAEGTKGRRGEKSEEERRGEEEGRRGKGRVTKIGLSSRMTSGSTAKTFTPASSSARHTAYLYDFSVGVLVHGFQHVAASPVHYGAQLRSIRLFLMPPSLSPRPLNKPDDLEQNIM